MFFYAFCWMVFDENRTIYALFGTTGMVDAGMSETVEAAWGAGANTVERVVTFGTGHGLIADEEGDLRPVEFRRL